jgi:hypothetical protein
MGLISLVTVIIQPGPLVWDYGGIVGPRRSGGSKCCQIFARNAWAGKTKTGSERPGKCTVFLWAETGSEAGFSIPVLYNEISSKDMNRYQFFLCLYTITMPESSFLSLIICVFIRG